MLEIQHSGQDPPYLSVCLPPGKFCVDFNSVGVVQEADLASALFLEQVLLSELNLERGMCTIPQESVLSRNYRVLVRAGSRANAEMHALLASHHGSFRRLLKVKVQSRPEKERINKLLSFLVV